MKFYITTPIFYSNGRPHIGHVLTMVFADVIARHQRLAGKDTFFLTGTDDHGSTVVRAAEENNLPPKEWSEKNAKEFEEAARNIGISFSSFIRTSDQKVHWPTAQELWRRLEASGDIYKKPYKGLYCVGHEAFITEKDLIDGKCPDHGTEPELLEEENYFFRLSKYADQLQKVIKSDEFEVIPSARKNEILEFIKNLEDVSFSRPKESLKGWGIPVPGDESQLMYVWADALTNYLSALDFFSPTSRKKDYWPPDLQVIGKDILRFHAAIWPAMLISAGIPLPKKLLVHGFITSGGLKMSKTRGNVINPFEYVDEFGIDALRYFLVAEISTTEDGDFSREKFITRYNGDLASGLGNLTSRILTLAKGDEYTVETSEKLGEFFKGVWTNYSKDFNEFNLRGAIGEVWKLIHFLDTYIEETKPWESKDKKILTDLLMGLANVAWLVKPFLPVTSDKIFGGLGVSPEDSQWNFKPKVIEPLFPKIE